MPKNWANDEKIVNFNKIYYSFNTFKHKDAPTKDPVIQRTILENVMDNTPELSGLARCVLLKIIRETVFRGQYYTFISQKQIAEDLGCSDRSVRNALKELKEINWIAVKSSGKKPFRNCIDFNVKRAMVLGKKFQLKRGREENFSSSIKKESKIDSKESIGSAKSATPITQEKILENVERRRRKPKKRMSAHSLSKTWKEGCGANPLCTGVHFTITQMDKNKLSTLTGNSRCQGKWNRSTDELHEMVLHLTTHWDYYFRQLGHKNMPKLPNIAYFVACFQQFYEIWLINLKDTHPDDSRITDLEKYRKWRDYDFSK